MTAGGTAAWGPDFPLRELTGPPPAGLHLRQMQEWAAGDPGNPALARTLRRIHDRKLTFKLHRMLLCGICRFDLARDNFNQSVIE